MRPDVLLEWTATAVLLIGVALTSYDVFPINLYVSLAGNLIWVAVGLVWKKPPLVITSGVISAVYLSGLVRLLLH
jgi:hypothetical protein